MHAMTTGLAQCMLPEWAFGYCASAPGSRSHVDAGVGASAIFPSAEHVEELFANPGVGDLAFVLSLASRMIHAPHTREDGSASVFAERLSRVVAVGCGSLVEAVFRFVA
jgi:hypothetical protein